MMHPQLFTIEPKCTGEFHAIPLQLRGRPQVDSFVLATAYAGKAEFVRVANCGHLLLADAPDECLAMIKRLLAEHVSTPERPEPA